MNSLRILISKLQDVQSDSIFWDSQSLGDPDAGIANPNTVFRDYLAVDKNFRIDEVGGSINVMTLLIGTNKNQFDTIPGFVKHKIHDSGYSRI